MGYLFNFTAVLLLNVDTNFESLAQRYRFPIADADFGFILVDNKTYSGNYCKIYLVPITRPTAIF